MFGLVLLSSPHSLAETSSDAIDLRYEAPSECPDRSDLLRAIRDRAPRGFLSTDDRSFRVHIERASDEYQARLEIERKGRVLSVREIRDPACNVVTTAVAVFVAIALDPAEATSDEEQASPPPRVLDVSPTEKTKAPERTVSALNHPELPSGGWYWGSGLDASAVFHPAMALGARVHAEIARLVPGALFAPELRLSWGWNELGESPPRGGEATFRFQTARAEACALYQRPPYLVAPCAGFEVGFLSATTRGLPRAGGTTEPWYAPTFAVRPGWFLTDWFSLEADVGVLVPLTQASFVIAEPDRTVYRIPRVAVTATAGFRFWARLP